MRTAIGFALIALSAVYVVAGLLRGWESVALGATALIVSGGVMLARGMRPRRKGPVAPVIPKAPRVPSLPPEPCAEPAPATRPDEGWQERQVIRPPAPTPDGPPKLTLVHSEGGPVDVRDFRRRAANNK